MVAVFKHRISTLMARPFQRRTCVYRRIFSRNLCGRRKKKGETTDARKYVRFYHFDAHTYSSRGDVTYLPLFVRPMYLMLATATRRMRKTSCHDTATGGGINYFPSRVILPRSREVSPFRKREISRAR